MYQSFAEPLSCLPATAGFRGTHFEIHCCIGYWWNDVKSVNNFSPKSEWRRPTRGKGHSCEDNIKTDFKTIGCELVDWAYLRQD